VRIEATAGYLSRTDRNGVKGDEQVLPALSWQQAAGHWTFAPIVTCLTAAAAAAYLWGVWRVSARHPARPWPWWRTWLFMSGLAVIVVATQSGIGTYDDVLFWDHMIQHLLLIMVAPPLLVLSQPITLLLHASRNPLHTWVKKAVRSRLATILTWPPFTIAAYAATIAGTHLTSAVNVVMTNARAHDAEHALYLAAGYLFFLSVLGREPIRWRIPYPMRILALVVIMPVDTFTGLVLGYSAAGLTGIVSRPWGPSPVDDVHLGGAVMWIGGDAIMLVLIMMVFAAWSKDDRGVTGGLGWLDSARQVRLSSLRGAAGGPECPPTGADAAPGIPAAERRDVDDDEEQLAAYNAYLARLGEAEAARETRRRG
jgi:cytochrome c oxidase assembly factor CtaG